MFHDPAPFGLPNDLVTMTVSITLAAVGLAWLHRTLGTDELVARAAWRYRDRGRIAGIVHTIRSLVELPLTQTVGWWATRIEFALAAAALLVATLGLAGLQPALGSSPMALPVFGLSLVGYAGIVVGIGWMRRIYLSPLELDPEVRWRYRD
jgi:hypothetical protein